MYDISEDPYCYPGTGVLRNKLDIRDAAQLESFEAEITQHRADEPLPTGRLGVRHFLAVHHHLFQDVYAWAGEIRTVRISKGSSVFCYPEHIRAQLGKLFEWLKQERFLRDLPADDFANRAAHFLSELNVIHAFREGNGRTQLTFLVLLAARAGHPLDLGRLDPQAFLDAMIASFNGDEDSLTQQIRQLTTTG